MPDPRIEIDVPAWVERARNDPVAYRSRQATEIILTAIAASAPLSENLCLKGGVLMGLVYDSPRQTTDIDLSTWFAPTQENAGTIEKTLNQAFPAIAAKLGYAGLALQVHSVEVEPRRYGFDAEFPALKLKIAHAMTGTPAHAAMLARRAADIVEVDISFNEPLTSLQVLEMTGGDELCAYSLTDLMAEKYRAMLQQVIRNRSRRQDVYDLDRLIQDYSSDAEGRASVFSAFIEKCAARHITPVRTSLDDPEVRRRSGADWNSLSLEVGALPEFEACFDRVRAFYLSLPWEEGG